MPSTTKRSMKIDEFDWIVSKREFLEAILHQSSKRQISLVEHSEQGVDMYEKWSCEVRRFSTNLFIRMNRQLNGIEKC